MKQIDAKPEEYRKQDPRTGRWLQNVDRKLCRWMSVLGVAFIAYIAWRYGLEGGSTMVVAACALMAFAAGAAFTLSLRTID